VNPTMRRHTAIRSPSPVPLRRKIPQELECEIQPLRRAGALDRVHSPQKRARTVNGPIRQNQTGRRQPKGGGAKSLKARTQASDSPQDIEGTQQQHQETPDMSTFEPNGIDVFLSPNKTTTVFKGAEDDFANYVEAVLSGSVGFIRLHGMMFAVEGWCKETGEGTVSITFLNKF
jgi:hypothetical protein